MAFAIRVPNEDFEVFLFARTVLESPAGFFVPMKHQDQIARPAWFIVNMCSRWGKEVIARGQKPTRLHATFASAYTEAVRLAESHSKGDYAIFECVGRVVSKEEKSEGAVIAEKLSSR